MPGPTRLARFAELLLLPVLGCQQAAGKQKAVQPRASTSAAPVSLQPRPASSFSRDGAEYVQLHPRLPDSGEWRCAERGQVVWCAGGEPAAGVVTGPADAAYLCGKRWGQTGPERVCVDRHPDYPPEAGEQACRFEQERGIQRRCRAASEPPAAALASGALPACWLDRDCPAGRCDRGSCACQADQDCLVGRCRSGSCVEVAR